MTITTTHHHEDNDITRVRVAVVGAGAAGLMCAHQLLTNKEGAITSTENMVILEARNRTGGRIHTTVEPAATPTTSRSSNSTTGNGDPVENRTVYRDHGAAWVHGTGCDWPHYPSANIAASENNDQAVAEQEDPPTNTNPMMELLQQITPPGENVCLTHLVPTFPLGNPWMRPGHVCVGPNQLALFVDGIPITLGGNKNDDEDSQPSNHKETTVKGMSQEESQDILILALQEHYDIMNQVGRLGYSLMANGNIQDTIDKSFQDALQQIASTKKSASDHDNSKIIELEENTNHTKALIPLVAAFYRYLIECWHGTSASGLQLLEFSAHVDSDDDADEKNTDDETKFRDEGDFYGPHCTMKQGMHAILTPLLEKVSPCIKLGVPVTRIIRQTSQDGDLIRLETSTGMAVEADYCIMTVPLGCLAESLRNGTENNTTTEGTIQFEPSLSPEKITAIQHMDMGCYKKVFLTFDRIFWPEKQAFLGLVRSKRMKDVNDDGDGIGNHLLLDNLWACKGIPCIEAVLIGTVGIWGTGKSDSVIRNAVLQFFADAMDLDLDTQLQEWCVDCHVTRWEEDPYSRGAYSGYRLGTTELHTQGLATSEWDGRLLFAGEATLSGYEGSVHAALISGRIAAKEIQSKLSGKAVEG